MGYCTNRRHLETYVAGQLGPLQRKSVEPIALDANRPVRTLQEFLSQLKWDHESLRNLHQQRVVRRHHHDVAIGLIDETSFPKKGEKTACVQRQHCGRLGKVDNCVVSVHLGYATPTFCTMLDGELFLPEHTWNDPARRREAGIPDDLEYRSKCRIALDLLDRARGNGLAFAWLTFDEGYGAKPWFLHELDAAGQRYVAEVPKTFRVWTKEPMRRRRHHHGDDVRNGQPALMVQTLPMSTVENVLAHSPRVRECTWQTYVVNDSASGPIVWEAIRIKVWLRSENGLPTRAHHLVIARPVLARGDIKFFLSNAPEPTSIEDLLYVAFTRWRVERLFQDTKTELGMNDFEVRRFIAIQRHLIISCVSHAFLAEFCEAHRPKSAWDHPEPGWRRGQAPGADLARRWPVLARQS
jgi:SRSO17 transposase